MCHFFDYIYKNKCYNNVDVAYLWVLPGKKMYTGGGGAVIV